MWPFRRRTPSMTLSLDKALPRRRLFGREYAAGVPYMLPKDLEEGNRLDFQHYMLRYVLHGNFAAPLGDVLDILDVGAGTGRWATEMADLFPQARVTGVDIAPPPALDNATANAPSNSYSFVAANVLEGLPFPDATFDFVHQRLLYAAIPADRWQTAVRELVRVTRPGGWIELVEGGIVQNGGPAVDMLQGWIIQACTRRGIDIMAGDRVGAMLETAGASGVTQHVVNLPLGRHGGRVGTMVETDILSVFKGYQAGMVAAGVVNEQAYNKALEGVRAEAADLPLVMPFYIAYGQRPN